MAGAAVALLRSGVQAPLVCAIYRVNRRGPHQDAGLTQVSHIEALNRCQLRVQLFLHEAGTPFHK